MSDARARWAGPLGDVGAAAAVLIGSGLLESPLFGWSGLFGSSGGPMLGGPPPGSPNGGDGVSPSLAGSLAALAVVVAPAALMFVRRRRPAAVFASVFAVFVASVLLGLPSLGPGVATVIAAYAFAFRAPRPRALVAAAVALAFLIALAFAATGWQSLDSRVFQIGAALAIAAALGDSARSRQEYLQQVEDRAVRAEQTREAEASRRVSEERLRIARDLHDTVAHQISVISLHAGVASGYLSSRPDRAEASLHTIRAAARGVLAEIGDLLRFLRDDERDGPGGQPGLAELDAVLGRIREAGLRVEVAANGDLARVTGTAGTVAYRVVQEGLTNAQKHGTGVAALRIDVGDREVRIDLTNPVITHGPAADPGAQGRAAEGTRLGLIGLRERVEAAGGRVERRLDAGIHRLAIALPLPEEEGAPR